MQGINGRKKEREWAGRRWAEKKRKKIEATEQKLKTKKSEKILKD